MATAGIRARRGIRPSYVDEGYSFRSPPDIIVPVLFGPFGTPVLDAFNSGTPNQALTSRASWDSATIVTGDLSCTTDQFPLQAVSAAATASNIWGATKVQDSETWVQFGAFNPHLYNIYVHTRQEAQGAAQTGYALQCGVQAGNDGFFRLAKFRAGSGMQIGTLLTQLVKAGDAVAIVVIGGSTIYSYYCPNGGSWTLKDTVIDNDTTLARIRGPGKYGGIRFGPTSTAVTIDTVGGGDLSHYNNAHAIRRPWAGR